ncbi:hypothetical protein [Derxia gummosa]|uniref:UDP-N-acetylmuramate--alanine ligase n=1 Tax=Derxia gummosa DSM 723 TaxID=1121388 RepID=A0A8B6X7B6_9BURK|nr:hypothetical protein [Derxia gummosa]
MPAADHLRERIAAAAARLVAEDGLDYASAKRKAAREVLGKRQPDDEVLPDDDEIEEELRTFQRLYQGESQPARLAELRRIALDVMDLLPHQPLWLVGQVANGTAGELSEIYLQAYVDSSKDIHIDLLNRDIDADADEIPNPFGRGRVERLSFLWQGEAVHITCYAPRQARQIGEQVPERLSREALAALLAG